MELLAAAVITETLIDQLHQQPALHPHYSSLPGGQGANQAQVASWKVLLVLLTVGLVGWLFIVTCNPDTGQY